MNDDTHIQRIELTLRYVFEDRSLLTTALTHTSFAAENHGVVSYERLEFLGDAILELVTTEMIFRAMPDEPEGVMTKLRAAVVDERTLAEVAGMWALADAIRVGIGEERSGGRLRPSLLSDVVEAVIAAVYLDGGREAADGLVRRVWGPIIDDRRAEPRIIDPRSELQELLAGMRREVIFEYERSGPDHATRFSATALVDGSPIGFGAGGSKKTAAIAAASDALQRGSVERLTSL